MSGLWDPRHDDALAQGAHPGGDPTGRSPLGFNQWRLNGSLRKGHDGLAALVQSMLQEDPFTGTVFVFRAKRADRLKILFWDDEADQETVRGTVSPTNGLVMAYKRLEETTFIWPAIRDGVMTLNRAQFEALFDGRGGSENSPGDCFPDASGARSGRWRRAGQLRQNESGHRKGAHLQALQGILGA